MVATNGATLSRFFMSNADFLKVIFLRAKNCCSKILRKQNGQKRQKNTKKDPKKGKNLIDCTFLH